MNPVQRGNMYAVHVRALWNLCWPTLFRIPGAEHTNTHTHTQALRARMCAARVFLEPERATDASSEQRSMQQLTCTTTCKGIYMLGSGSCSALPLGCVLRTPPEFGAQLNPTVHERVARVAPANARRNLYKCKYGNAKVLGGPAAGKRGPPPQRGPSEYSKRVAKVLAGNAVT